MSTCTVSKSFSTAAVKLWHRSEVERMKSGSLIVASENVLTKSRDTGPSICIPTVSLPIRLQITVPSTPDTGVLGKHVIQTSYSENLLQHMTSSEEPGEPKGVEGFMWRLTRPFEAFFKKRLGEEKKEGEDDSVKSDEETPKDPTDPPKN